MVLVPLLLVPPYWPAVVVTTKLWTTALSSRRVFSRFCVNTGGMHARTFNSDGYIAMKLNKIHFNSSKHNGYHVVYRSTTSNNVMGATISFISRHCKSYHSLWCLRMLTNQLLNAMAARAPLRRHTHVCLYAQTTD